MHIFYYNPVAWNDEVLEKFLLKIVFLHEDETFWKMEYVCECPDCIEPHHLDPVKHINQLAKKEVLEVIKNKLLEVSRDSGLLKIFCDAQIKTSVIDKVLDVICISHEELLERMNKKDCEQKHVLDFFEEYVFPNNPKYRIPFAALLGGAKEINSSYELSIEDDGLAATFEDWDINMGDPLELQETFGVRKRPRPSDSKEKQ